MSDELANDIRVAASNVEADGEIPTRGRDSSTGSDSEKSSLRSQGHWVAEDPF